MEDESIEQALRTAQGRLAEASAEKDRRESERTEALFTLRSDRARLEEQVTSLRFKRDELREEVTDLSEQLAQARGVFHKLRVRWKERPTGRRG